MCVCVMIGCLLAVLKDKANSPACVLFEKAKEISFDVAVSV